MARFWVAVAALAAVTAAVPSPETVKSDITLLMTNDLQGKSPQGGL